ncbi:MAG: rhamnogalacturonan lyase, partial [Thermoguttaceae bacterium]
MQSVAVVEDAETSSSAHQMESLDRGVVAINEGGGSVYVGWRLFATDSSSIGFNIYRSTGGATAVKLNSSVITDSTNYLDSGVDTTKTNTYFVRTVLSGVEQDQSESYTLGANASAQQYLSVPLQIPAGVTTPDGVTCTYSANDCTVADLDGDGQYEIIVKWDPSNSKDNSQSGYTGNVYVDAYKLDGTRLWRIDLGKNIRAGAHYTQIIAYDLDGDGCAEVAMKTAPYTMVTTNYYPARGTVSSWGDTYGNRCDRYLAAVAYLDGVRPSLIECRGYYGPQSGISTAKNFIVAWNYRNGTLTRVWTFEAAVGQDGNINSAYVGQGDHSLSIADVDGDGKDEIIYGACVIDDNGQPLYTTGLGHGDAMDVGDLNPNRPGLEVYEIHESGGTDAYEMHDADTGQILWGEAYSGDTDRGRADNIINGMVGAQCWGAHISYLYDCNGNVVMKSDGVTPASPPSSDNMLVWWDGDTSRELENGISITKYSTSGETTLLTATGCSSNNGTKSTPCLVADILGDWREEVIWRASDSSELRIYTTTDVTTTRIYTLMDDLQYRESIAWQNVAYNQPAHTSFYLGYGMSTPPTPNIYVVQSSLVPPAAPTGLAVTVASSSEIDLTWTTSSGATSYRVKRSDNSGGPFYTIATGVTGLSYSDTTVASGGTYYYVVSAVSSSGGSDNSVQAAASIPLISPWVSQDIGSVGVAGRTTYSSGIFTVTGSNANSPDGLQFATQGLIGNSTLICQVVSQDSATGTSGLMIRKSTSSTSAYASIVVAADTNKHIFFYYRSSDGGSVKYGYTYYTALPIWLKLVRSGSSFSGYYSTDGSTWTQVGSTQTISMNTLTLGGLAVCSDGTYLSSTTEFSNVSITSANTAPTVSTAAQATPSIVTAT